VKASRGNLCRYSDSFEVERSRNLDLEEKARFLRGLGNQLGDREHAVIATDRDQVSTPGEAQKGVSAINNLVCTSFAATGASCMALGG
jgi:hypothetical protein